MCYRSGAEEEYTEKDVLLQEVIELQKEAEEAVKQKAAIKDEKENVGLNIRKRAMEGMVQGNIYKF